VTDVEVPRRAPPPLKQSPLADGTVPAVSDLLYGMTSRPQKNPATAKAEDELARFQQAVDEFECRSDETQFDETVRNLTSVEWSPSDQHASPSVVPVRYDETAPRDLEKATPIPVGE